jgi:anti-sigma B factor antagonist/stage II sporulation protein AA (anti-sigma F factor antagonist)
VQEVHVYDSEVPPTSILVESRLDEAGNLRLAVSGEVDMSNADDLRETIIRQSATVRPDRGVVVDLARLTFLDSTGVAALVVAQREGRRQGVRVTVTNAHGMVRRVLDTTGVLGALSAGEAPQEGPGR